MMWRNLLRLRSCYTSVSHDTADGSPAASSAAKTVAITCRLQADKDRLADSHRKASSIPPQYTPDPCSTAQT